MEKEICWNITARCNQTCKYCHRFLNLKDLSFEEHNTILDNLLDSGVTDITWTGGEALLVKDLEKLLKKSYEHGVRNKLITNGKLLTPKMIDKIAVYMDSITLSIDSVDNNINEMIGRGVNHYSIIKNILDYITLKYPNIKIRINTVVCKYTKRIEQLAEFLNNYNIYSWRIFKFMPLRELAVINKNDFYVSMEEYKEIFDLAKEKSKIDIIDSRTELDMEKKYILILADGSIMVTEKGKDIKIGNALVDKVL